MTKDELLAPLRAAGVCTKVRLEYSGSNDEGYLNDVEYLDAEGKQLSVPNPMPEFSDWSDIHDRALEAADLDGYWNNDGGSGNIEIDVATGKVTINHGWYETVCNDDDPMEVEVE